MCKQDIKDEFRRAPISSIAAIIATFCAIGTLLTGIWLGASWTRGIEEQLAYNNKSDHEHHKSQSLHMPYEDKVREFLTRLEWNAASVGYQRQFSEIRESQVRQETKIDKIYEIITR